MSRGKAATAAPSTEQIAERKEWRYKVTHARIGHEVGTILTYGHEPDVVFLACLEPIEE